MSVKFLTVGSLLRNEELLKYKREIEDRDDIKYPFYDDLEGYKKCEDEAVKKVVEDQIKAGLVQITDGEYSKSLWHLDFVWGFHGVERFIRDSGYFFRENDSDDKFETRRDIGIKITDKLSGKNHPFIDHFKRLKKYAGDRVEVKQCIPSPSHIYGELLNFKVLDQSPYESNDEFAKDLKKSYKEFIDEFNQVGGEIIQFDDCLWEQFSKENKENQYDNNKTDLDKDLELANTYIDINNEVIDYAHSLGLKVYTHNCRGNYSSRNFSDGTYESIADLFLRKLKYDRFYLEWDDERAGSLDALNAFKDRDDVEVVIGLLSSKTSQLDDEKRVFDLLEKASQIIDKDRLYLSHQCGFASCDNGNELSIDQQWAKIAQGQDIAYRFWGI